jgi:hypothetical protein
MDRRKKKHTTIMDPFLIPLEVPCDMNKQTKDDSNSGCFIILDVPSVSDYPAGAFMENEETFDVDL